MFTIDSAEKGNEKRSGLEVIDQPAWSISRLLTLPRSQWKQYLTGKPTAHARIYLGRDNDRSAALELKDADGRDRITIRVARDGSPTIQLLDAKGKVVSQLPEKSSR
jgi:hypothetical protein